MSYEVRHPYALVRGRSKVAISGERAVVSFAAEGTLRIRHPGRLEKGARMSYWTWRWEEDTGVGNQPGAGEWVKDEVVVLLTLTIRTPDGKPFTRDHVTLDDIRRFRDLRGTSLLDWTFEASGKTGPIIVDEERVEHGDRVRSGEASVRIGLVETVPSQSARPLVSATVPASERRRYEFDLFRVGTFTASARRSRSPLGGGPPSLAQRALRLIDPDGVTVARGERTLTFAVTVATLGRSRDAAGRPRKWALEVLEGAGAAAVSATVVANARVSLAVLQSRIDTILGKDGDFISVHATDLDALLLTHLKISDPVSAGTLDMTGLLDDVIPGAPDINSRTTYTIAHVNRLYTWDPDGPSPSVDFEISSRKARVRAIHVSIGPGERLNPALPTLKIALDTEGDLVAKMSGADVLTAKVRGNGLELEGSVRVKDGAFEPEVWVPASPLDIDGAGPGVPQAAAEWLESAANDAAREALEALLRGLLGGVARAVRLLNGGEFDIVDLRIDGDDVVLKYIAPTEPDPKPYKDYVPIQGRKATQLGPGAWRFVPPSLGDTWAAQNLTAGKIDHIVVVMMENRSFDHTLGYLAQVAGHERSDGLTAELTRFLAAKGYPIERLQSLKDRIEANAFGLRTRFPGSPGHGFADVAEQLSEKLTTGSGRVINSPAGFVSNFAKKLPRVDPVLLATDVLGYYENVADPAPGGGADKPDLELFDFLVKHYAYCARFFCSHPGPTLPNRMLSLSGDLQYDGTGEAIVDNNHGDNFFLSRAPTIFDLLTRKGVSWRVYESPPSVTMLRMFARYAGDNANVVPFSRLSQDVGAGALPAVTFVDPAMHHSPENDDHPPSDMYNGQTFLKRVYDALRSNDAVWRKTLLVITYDEHGGFYDHVVPPAAEARTRPLVADPGDPPGPAPFTPSTLTTMYGLRVPTFVVSPWVPAGPGPDLVLDFCSILKTILVRFCPDRPFLSDRVHAARSFDAYLSETSPRMNVPSSPDMPELELDSPHPPRFAGSRIETDLVSRERMRAGNVDSHDLMGMVARMLGR